jgi:cysteine peptidase B
MRVAVLLLVLVAVCAATPINFAAMFQNFKKEHGRVYATPSEEAKRFSIFVQNMKMAQSLMAANPLAVFGANQFSDLSAEEFKVYHNSDKFYAKAMSQAKEPRALFTAEQVKAAAATVDWRQKGAVTPVKNQGQCGSCWAFSTTGGIEGQWFLAGNTLTSLSEQLLVSCDTIDDGCNGGLMDQAFQWLINDHKGIIFTEASYPYVSGNGYVPSCNENGHQNGATIIGYQDLPKNEQQMATWVQANGPLSIAVDATSWQSYTSGIMTNCISQQIDHGVLIVGFDSSNNPPYWIIKNSWAPSWGEDGYMRLARGKNKCGISNFVCSIKA